MTTINFTAPLPQEITNITITPSTVGGIILWAHVNESRFVEVWVATQLGDPLQNEPEDFYSYLHGETTDIRYTISNFEPGTYFIWLKARSPFGGARDKVGPFTLNTETLSGSSGGTGLTTYATGDLLYASSTTELARRAIGSEQQVLTAKNGLPVWDKGQGALLANCRAVATANIVTSGNRVFDGITTAAGDRILLTAQTTATENGVWIASTGAWSKASDDPTFPGALVAIGFGTSGSGTVWRYAGGTTWTRVGDQILLTGSSSTGLTLTPSAMLGAFATRFNARGNQTCTLTLAGTLNPTSGGTGLTTYATGDLLFASDTNVLAKRAIGTTGQVLTVSGGVPTWAPSASRVDVQIFTSSGTWTKPDGAKTCTIYLVGGGGGGGSGASNNNDAQVGSGGSGGGGGGVTLIECVDADLFGATETVAVGAGGAGGVATTIQSSTPQQAAPVAGSAGGTTSFGDFRASGGNGGGAGGGGAGGSSAMFSGLAGGPSAGSSSPTQPPNQSSASFPVPAGGGGGAGLNSTLYDVTAVPASGGWATSAFRVSSVSGGAAGTTSVTTTPSTAGSAGSTFNFLQNLRGGTGGGGGGAWAHSPLNQAVGANGGAGGFPGGGGGGGGACKIGNLSGSPSVKGGNGGNGASGVAVIITYL